MGIFDHFLKKDIAKMENFSGIVLEALKRDDGYFCSNSFAEEISLLEEMYIRLKEKFKYDKGKLLELAEDWMDCLGDLSWYLNQYCPYTTMNEGKYELAKEGRFKSEEIENRFSHLLGAEYEKRLKDIRAEYKINEEKKVKEFWKKHKK